MTEATGHTLQFKDAQGAKREMIAVGTAACPDRFLLYPPDGAAGGATRLISYDELSSIIWRYAAADHPTRLKVQSLGGHKVRDIFNKYVDPDGHENRKKRERASQHA